MYRIVICLLMISATVAIAAAPPAFAPPVDLTGYRTADTAVSTKVAPAPAVARAGAGAGYLGVHATRDGDRLTVREIHPGSPAASAVEVGDVLHAIDGVPVGTADALREAIQSRSAGDKLALALTRQGKRVEASVTLAANTRPLATPGRGGGRDGGRGFASAGPSLWKKPTFRLGVVVIEYPDVKANKKITPRAWETAFFSSGAYDKSPTGERACGSLNDYFREQSYGKFKLEGRAFAPVQVAKKRADYVEGSGTSNKSALPSEALARLLEREGEDRLADFDGFCFVYAGARVASNRGGLYFPHVGSLSLQGKRVNYVLCPEGGTAMEPIAPFALEMCKLLGLPSLAARTEQVGSSRVDLQACKLEYSIVSPK